MLTVDRAASFLQRTAVESVSTQMFISSSSVMTLFVTIHQQISKSGPILLKIRLSQWWDEPLFVTKTNHIIKSFFCDLILFRFYSSKIFPLVIPLFHW